jgi:hypothetical protein
MRIVHSREGWRIEGPSSHRARIAYANLEADRLVYTVEEVSTPRPEFDAVQASSEEAVPTTRDAGTRAGNAALRPRRVP